MDGREELDLYINQKSDFEIASDIHYALVEYFGSKNHDFLIFYKNELGKLRKRDALRMQIKTLKSYQRKLKNNKKNILRIKELNVYQNEIRLKYQEWKNSKISDKIRCSNIDMENFYYECKNEIKQIIGCNNISVYAVKLLLKGKEQPVPIPLPSKKISIPELIKNNVIDIDINYSKKSDDALLAELGKPHLLMLLESILASWDTNDVSIIKANLSLIIGHFCSSNTKGKEYAREKNGIIPNASKTKGKSCLAYWEEYQQLVSELKSTN